MTRWNDGCCPGCDDPDVEMLELRYGSGASAVTELRPSHCRACLRRRVVTALLDVYEERRDAGLPVSTPFVGVA